jgi:VanZ family protein
MTDSRNENHARLGVWLVSCYILFILYASLSPFSGWRDQGLSFVEVLKLPLLLNYSTSDTVLNVLAYLPLGLLMGLILRTRISALPSLISACLFGISLSISMEYLQMFLPVRTSSSLDLLTNSCGTLIGALLAISMTRWTSLLNLLTDWRNHTFLHDKKMDFGLALLALWLFGQINPSLPMLGNVFISQVAHQPFAAAVTAPFHLAESAAVMLNLLMLGTLLLTLLRNKMTVTTILLLALSCVALIKFITAAVLVKSSAMLMWINGEAMLGILLGTAALLAMRRLNLHAIVRIGMLQTLGYIVIAHLVLDSGTPAAAMSIYQWHYGHLLNYNGLAQTITLAFPVLLFMHLYRLRNA